MTSKLHFEKPERRYAVGAELVKGGVHFRVWAPEHAKVAVVVEGEGDIPLHSEGGGYFAGTASKARAGSLYRIRLGDRSELYADPASRFQPDGPHGPSQVVDPNAFTWSHPWRGADEKGQVIYELHIGTFTHEGTWAAAMRELPHLATLGITLIEMMPVHEFPGEFGWGYDGVNLFAPTHLYGTPDDFRAFVDEAHHLGLGVILDVVYNHLGPDGNYLREFSPTYFTDHYQTDWGVAINFEGDLARPVREFFSANAAYWVSEFHLDGLRLDATQCVFDSSKEHILTELTARARKAAGDRPIYMVGENEPQDAKLVRGPAKGGYGLDALWNDDWHHAAMVALTGRSEAYYSDYKGSPQEFISAAKWGFLYQGQRYSWQKARRGSVALDLPAWKYVVFLQNHDQVANSARGERITKLASPGRLRAMTALLLLGPQTPMLFQGQEFGASTNFLYFADHKDSLAPLVHKGRKEFLRQFRALAQADVQDNVDDPAALSTFESSKLDLIERLKNEPILTLHRELLALRKSDPVFAAQRADRMHGAILGSEAFVLRFMGEADGERLLFVNLGRELHLDPAPEPLLAPPADQHWEIAFSTEDARYGGSGTAPLESADNWRLPGNSAVVMTAVKGAPVAEEKKS